MNKCEYVLSRPAYSHVVTVTGPGKTIYITGQLARDAEGNIVGPGDMRAQLEQTFKARSFPLIRWSSTMHPRPASLQI